MRVTMSPFELSTPHTLVWTAKDKLYCSDRNPNELWNKSNLTTIRLFNILWIRGAWLWNVNLNNSSTLLRFPYWGLENTAMWIFSQFCFHLCIFKQVHCSVYIQIGELLTYIVPVIMVIKLKCHDVHNFKVSHLQLQQTKMCLKGQNIACTCLWHDRNEKRGRTVHVWYLRYLCHIWYMIYLCHI